MRSVFISYARSGDREFVESLRKNLVSSGFEFLDGLQQRLQSPESVFAAIRRADVVLSVIHNQPLSVLLELGFAVGVGKSVFLITDPTEELPSELSGFQTIRTNQSNRDLIFEVLRRIEQLDLPPSQPVPEQSSAIELLSTFHTDPERFRSIDPRKFEELVAEVYQELGFEVQLSGRSADRGVDLIISDPKGHTLAVQCKKRSSHRRTAISEIRELIGATMLSGASKGILVTTSGFTKSARDLVERSPIDIELVSIEGLLQQAKQGAKDAT